MLRSVARRPLALATACLAAILVLALLTRSSTGPGGVGAPTHVVVLDCGSSGTRL
jgi:hypothetical protein